jgi:hypothetical protein
LAGLDFRRYGHARRKLDVPAVDLHVSAIDEIRTA